MVFGIEVIAGGRLVVWGVVRGEGVGVTSLGAGLEAACAVGLVVGLLIGGFVFVEVFFFLASYGVAFSQ